MSAVPIGGADGGLTGAGGAITDALGGGAWAEAGGCWGAGAGGGGPGAAAAPFPLLPGSFTVFWHFGHLSMNGVSGIFASSRTS
jgi:hypothetical protein